MAFGFLKRLATIFAGTQGDPTLRPQGAAQQGGRKPSRYVPSDILEGFVIDEINDRDQNRPVYAYAAAYRLYRDQHGVAVTHKMSIAALADAVEAMAQFITPEQIARVRNPEDSLVAEAEHLPLDARPA